MGLLKYYLRIFRVAFTHSLGVAQDIIFVLFIVFGLATVWAKAYKPQFVAMIPDVSTAQIALMVFLAIVVLRLLLAPYWVWQEQNEKITELQKGVANSDKDMVLAAAQKLNERRASLISAGRALAAELASSDPKDGGGTIKHQIANSRVYFDLRQHLDPEFDRSLYGRRTSIAAGQKIDQTLDYFLRELEKLQEKWGIEITETVSADDGLKKRRASLISDGRKHISGIVNAHDGILVVGGDEKKTVKYQLKISTPYLALRPYLSEDFTKMMNSEAIQVVVGSSVPGEAYAFMRELDRLEKEWNVGV